MLVLILFLQVPCGGVLPLKVKCLKDPAAKKQRCKAKRCDRKQVFECNVEFGLKCIHAKQPTIKKHQCQCCNWKVKFLCPPGGCCRISVRHETFPDFSGIPEISKLLYLTRNEQISVPAFCRTLNFENWTRYWSNIRALKFPEFRKNPEKSHA